MQSYQRVGYANLQEISLFQKKQLCTVLKRIAASSFFKVKVSDRPVG